MAWQLIYTSAPRLLDAGRSGFGTVARNRDMRPLLVAAIERVSSFDRAQELDRERVIFAFRHLVIGHTRYFVMSRIADAGADHTGRTNHVAHHVIAEQQEISALISEQRTPADLLLTLPWCKRWDAHPHAFEEHLELRSLPQATPDGWWRSLTGDQRHANVLLSEDALRGCYVYWRVDRTTDADQTLLVSLFNESLSLRPRQSWETTFTTNLQPSDDAHSFQWRGIVEGSPLLRKAGQSGRRIVDLTQPQSLPLPDEFETHPSAEADKSTQHLPGGSLLEPASFFPTPSPPVPPIVENPVRLGQQQADAPTADAGRKLVLWFGLLALILLLLPAAAWLALNQDKRRSGNLNHTPLEPSANERGRSELNRESSRTAPFGMPDALAPQPARDAAPLPDDSTRQRSIEADTQPRSDLPSPQPPKSRTQAEEHPLYLHAPTYIIVNRFSAGSFALPVPLAQSVFESATFSLSGETLRSNGLDLRLNVNRPPLFTFEPESQRLIAKEGAAPPYTLSAEREGRPLVEIRVVATGQTLAGGGSALLSPEPLVGGFTLDETYMILPTPALTNIQTNLKLSDRQKLILHFPGGPTSSRGLASQIELNDYRADVSARVQELQQKIAQLETRIGEAKKKQAQAAAAPVASQAKGYFAQLTKGIAVRKEHSEKLAEDSPNKQGYIQALRAIYAELPDDTIEVNLFNWANDFQNMDERSIQAKLRASEREFRDAAQKLDAPPRSGAMSDTDKTNRQKAKRIFSTLADNVRNLHAPARVLPPGPSRGDETLLANLRTHPLLEEGVRSQRVQLGIVEDTPEGTLIVPLLETTIDRRK